MTSSINFKKLVSVGAALLIAIGGSLIASGPAKAAAATSAPVIAPGVFAGASATATPAVWGSGSASGKWYICQPGGSTASANSIPFGCEALQVSGSNATAFTTTLFTVPLVAFCTTSCTNAGTNSVGSYLRWIEQNGSDYSASAAVMIREERTLTLSPSTAGDTTINLSVSGGCSFTSPSVPASTDWSVVIAGSSRTITNISTTNSTISLAFSGASLTAGQAISVSYAQGTQSQIVCTPTGAIANTSTPLTGTVPNNNNNNNNNNNQTYTMTSAPSYSITNGVATANDGTWSGGTPVRWWILCDTAISTPLTTMPPMDCYPIYTVSTGGAMERSSTFTLVPTVYIPVGGNGRNQVTFSSKYFGLYVSNGGSDYVTATSAGPAPSVSSVTAPALSPEQARNQIKPLPVIVQPLVAALPSLSKPLVDAGGKVDLKAGDFTGLVSASISGKTIDLTVGATGSLTITVPNGKAGTTADLLLNFKSGTVILQDAIKYVAPVVVAQVPVRPVSIKAGAKKLSATAADEIRHAAFANLKNNSIECVAYAASAANADAAKATAQQACDLAVKSNPDLVNTSVVVVIDKIKAATQGVGIRVYKQ